jgi:hypothetical protein
LYFATLLLLNIDPDSINIPTQAYLDIGTMYIQDLLFV